MAADSRITGSNSTVNQEANEKKINSFTISDNGQKLIMFDKVKMGISFCGDLEINGQQAVDALRSFEIIKLEKNDTPEIVADKLIEFLNGHCSTSFFLCGYYKDIPYVYDISRSTKTRFNVSEAGQIIFNAMWNGKVDAITKLINGDPKCVINYNLLPLKDGIDLAEYLIDLTIKYERFYDSIQTCGGPIDVLVLTKDRTFWYRHKIYKQ